MMLRKYLFLGTLVFTASIPFSVWIIRHWKEAFTAQAPVPVWIFLLAWLLVLGTSAAVITLMSHTIVRTNPAVELKKE